jgi:prepilin signal peptidase PulO-like enzyme (type II secretory pathway)
VVLIHFVLFAGVISFRDISSHRIKKRDVYLALFTILPFIDLNSLLFAAVNGALYAGIRRLSSNQLGKGDVRLAPLIGVYISMYEEEIREIFVVNLMTWSVAGVVALYLMLKGKNRAHYRIPFAPFMFLGVLLHVTAQIAAENCSPSAIIVQCVGLLQENLTAQLSLAS